MSLSKHFTLDEVLGIMFLFTNKYSLGEVALISKHSKSQLYYYFLRKKCSDGKVRSVRKYKSFKQLYKDYGEKYINNLEVQERAFAYWSTNHLTS